MKFKPIMLAVLLLSVIMIMNVGAAPVGDQEQITIAQVLASPNSQRVHPGVLLIDAKPETYWAVNPNSGEGWAELRLNQAALIHGLELSGSLGNGNSLILEYRQADGYWTAFLTGRLGSIPSHGIIDLSYDRIVTGTIRLRIAGANPEQARLNEVKVLGRPAKNVFHRINPRSVEASGHTSYLTRAEFLTDGNTNTYWMVKPRYRSGNNWLFETIETYLGIPIDHNYNFNWPNRPSYYNYGEVLFDLGEAQTIANINIFFTKDARGDLIIESDQGGKWTKLGVIPKPDHSGWQRLVLNRPAVSKIRLTMEATGHESVGGIGEVEFWGQGGYSGNSRLELGPENLPLTTAVNRKFKLTKEAARDHRLDLAVANGSGETPVIELNGLEYSLVKSCEMNGHEVFSLPLTGNMLADEMNYLRIKPRTGTLTGLKLTYSGDGTQSHQTPVLNDGMLLTPGTGATEQIIQLDQEILVEQVEVYLGEEAPLDLSYLNGNKWVTLNPVTTGIPGYLRYYNSFATDQIKINNPSGIVINEVRVQGSPITDQAPAVRLLRPEDYEVFDCDQLSDKYLVGSVDNPRAKVKVNGKEVFQIGHYYGCHLTAIGIPTWEETEVEAVATDPEGRVGRYKTRILIDKLPWFTIDQPENTVTTVNPVYQISGELKKPNCILKVNGQTVIGKKGKFSTQVALVDGLNRIKIECVYTKPGSTNSFTQTAYRKVVRQRDEVRLQVNAPLDGSRIAASTVMVSGNVYGSGTPQVWVNGKAASVTGERFSATVALVEGKNEIEITARSGGASDSIRLTLWRDMVSPALTVTAPLDQTITNNANVAVTGTISDTSPVSVLVNGRLAEMTDGQFSAVLNLPEGWNQILVKAQDEAGNITVKELKVMVDTEAPLPFTPSADPSDWTNNNRPVISFATTDATSGIDHYEIRVDDGTWITPVTSPYQFATVIPDGERTVQVKAVDKTGNETIGEVKVYIDTTPPAAPKQFEVISGIGRAELRWEDPQGEVKGYRITRTPAFSSGSYKELYRVTKSEKINRYMDPDLVAGAEYKYCIQAIDRAGNYGVKTAQLSIKVGEASQEIGTDGGTVKFDNCEITLAKDALNAQYRIIMKQTSEVLPDNEYGTKTGPAYSFTLVNQSGEEVTEEFNEPVILTVNYASFQISEGFSAEDLGIYWYNKNGEYWERLDHCQNDVETKTLTVPLLHFSEYQVMASEYTAPSLDSYYELGVAPYQSYFQNNTETISPEYGGLTISATDLRLPGPAGFDLVIKRIYDTGAAQQQRIMEIKKEKSPIDTFGCSWSLNIPWIETNPSGKFLRLPEGQTIKIGMNSDGYFYYHKGVHFCLEYTNKKRPSRSDYLLTLKDGTQYEINRDGKVTRQTDPSGLHTIVYSYDNRKLNTITDSIGRVVSFKYISIGSKQVISKISVGPDLNNQREIVYEYDNGNNGNDTLTHVYDPLKRCTVYSYELHQDLIVDNKKYNLDLLNSITYPTGAVSSYKYDIKRQEAKGNRRIGDKILVTKHTLQDKITLYSYDLNQNYYINYDYVPSNKYIKSCTITEDNANNKTITLQFNQIGQGSNLVDSFTKYSDYVAHQGSLMISRRTVIGGNKECEYVTYQYDVPARAVMAEYHYRNNELKYRITNIYDHWGNLINRFDGSRDLKEEWTYHALKADPSLDHSKNLDLSRIRNLVATDTKYNVNPLDGSQMITKICYIYDEDLGKPLTMTVNDGKQDLVTRFTYYSKQDGKAAGSLKTRTEPNVLVTEFTYDANGFPQSKKAKNVKDADGIGTDIETKYIFNWWGLKESETDPLGFTTSYKYDKLNRVTEVTLPDDDQDDENNPFRKYEFNDAENYCDFFNEKGQRTKFQFDGLGRLTEVIKYTDGERYSAQVSTGYHYDTLGRIDRVTDPMGRVTTYAYDGLNRVIKVTYPDTSFVTLEYDDVTNTVTITDEEGGKVTERSDWANRLVEAKQYCYYMEEEKKTLEGVFTWSFAYDSLGNKVQQLDPLLQPVDLKYDPLGRLIETKLPAANLLVPGKTVSETLRPVLKYEYDQMGNRTAEISANGNASGNPENYKTKYEYDLLGRTTKVITKATEIVNGSPVLKTYTTRHYYDAAGNKKKTVLPNGKELNYEYSARGWLLSETDPLGNTIRYQYDALGNKIAVTDPRGNGTDGKFTTWYVYDDLNRLYRTVLPDGTPPSDPYGNPSGYDNPYMEITYDLVGNKVKERDANGVKTGYEYDSRNRLVKVFDNRGRIQKTYTYDKKGNPTEVTDILNNTVTSAYDSLGRLRKVTDPLTNSEEYQYDAVGNKIAVTDARGNTTNYSYNSLGWLIAVRQPLGNFSQYRYDANGNRVESIAPNNLVTQARYDEMNRLVETIDSLKNSTKYRYDPIGNRSWTRDRRGTEWNYQYYDNNLLKRAEATGVDGTIYWAEYTYDQAGNRQTVKDSGNEIKYNFEGDIYRPDPLNRINNINRSFDGASYGTAYRYNPAGQVTGIKYPEATGWVEYQYNDLNQLAEVTGFTAPQGISYHDDGALKGIDYANGAKAVYNYDKNRRLDDMKVTVGAQELLSLDYTYDQIGNVKTVIDNGKLKSYEYDNNNQLTKAVTPGIFMEPTPTPGTAALKVGDTLGNGVFEFAPILSGLMGLDYHASSIGIDFGVVAPGVKRIELVPDKDYTTHRINEDTIALYVSNDNINYTLVPKANWEYQKDDQGIITLTLKERLATRYLKLHVKYDERGWDFKPVNKATFLNEIAKMLRVYQEADSRTEEYQYDMAGNRKLLRVTIARTLDYHSQYYTNTDRLKTDGKYAFVYDEAGNMVKKGNTFTISGDTVTFTETSGEGVEYWEYRYDLLNRLIKVTKNGNIVAEYGYDPEGFRVVKKAKGETTHYVFEGTEPIFEKRISTGKMKSFVYALGKHLARVDGTIGDPDAKKYWYVTDHLGSVRAVTDIDGKKVWSADYLAFGKWFDKNADVDFEELHSFTGKEFDPDTGLHYYNARWYDAELGRFISEDPAGDPNNPNLYSYTGNNPLRFIDPTGLYGYDASKGTISHPDGTITDTNGNPISTPPGGSNPGYYYGGSGSPMRKGAAGLGPVGDFLDKLGNWLAGKGWRLNTDEENAARALRVKLEEKGYVTEAEIRRVCEKYGIVGGVIGGFAYEGLSDVYALAELMSKYRFSWDPIGILNFIRFGYDYVSSAVTIAEMVFTSDKTEVIAFLDEMKDGLGEQFVQPFIDIYNTFDSGGITVENSFEFGRNAYRALSTIIIAYTLGRGVIKGGTALAKVFNKEIGILSQGPVNTYVYLGVKNGKFDYVGITNNPARRALEHGARFDRLQILTKDPVTRKQARAIEQVLKESNQFSNIRNSISPARSWYSEAINWGTNWLKSQGLL